MYAAVRERKGGKTFQGVVVAVNETVKRCKHVHKSRDTANRCAIKMLAGMAAPSGNRPPTPMAGQGLFAFWSYHTGEYSTALGAPVIEMLPSGRVRVEGYPGMSFTPIKLLPLDEGKKVHMKLHAIRVQFDRDFDKLSVAAKVAASNLLGVDVG